MIAEKIKTLSDFLSYCKMPIYFKADIKKMGVGDIFFMAKIPTKVDGINGVCEAWIEKSRGKYTFFSTFTLLTKRNTRLIVTQGDFSLKNGGLISFADEEGIVDKIKQFSLVCRYLILFYKNLSYKEQMMFINRGIKPLFFGVTLNSDFVTKTKQVVMCNGKPTLKFVNCDDFHPEQQLMAIVEAGLETGNVPLH